MQAVGLLNELTALRKSQFPSLLISGDGQSGCRQPNFFALGNVEKDIKALYTAVPTQSCVPDMLPDMFSGGPEH